MILDADLLLYSVDSSSPHHEPAVGWLEDALSGPVRVGFPIQTLTSFARIATHPRVMTSPLGASDVSRLVVAWLDEPSAWVPEAGRGTWRAARQLLEGTAVTGNLLPDLMLAALALQYGVPVVSADTDFARFPQVRWINPVA